MVKVVSGFIMLCVCGTTVVVTVISMLISGEIPLGLALHSSVMCFGETAVEVAMLLAIFRLLCLLWSFSAGTSSSSRFMVEDTGSDGHTCVGRCCEVSAQLWVCCVAGFAYPCVASPTLVELAAYFAQGLGKPALLAPVDITFIAVCVAFLAM